jgi:hypothetical protein
MSGKYRTDLSMTHINTQNLGNQIVHLEKWRWIDEHDIVAITETWFTS